MKRTLLLVLAIATCGFAQDGIVTVATQDGGPPINAQVGGILISRGLGSIVKGAPYSATISNESVQTLADGNRIVQTSTGNIARDSQGRTRQDAPFPAIANLSAANAPHIVFIQDPVAQTSYTLDMTDKTAQKMPPLGAGFAAAIRAEGAAAKAEAKAAVAATVGGGNTFFIARGGDPSASGALPPPLPPLPAITMEGQGQVTTENLQPQTMEGVYVTGVRTTQTIPAGAIGNEQPIVIVTEVWTSPDLYTIVSSKRSDPRTGEQTFRLTNITRAEPDPSLFTIPADFKVVDLPQAIRFAPAP